MPNARFWVLLAVFQVLFALAVFGLTRHYYMSSPRWTDTPPSAFPPRTELPATAMNGGLADSVASLALSPLGQNPGDLAAQADQFFGQQQYEAAARLYRQAIDAGATDVTTYNNLGLTLHYIGRSVEGLGVLAQGVTMDPDYQRIWLTIGFVNAQLGNTAQAQEALATAVRMAPDNDDGEEHGAWGRNRGRRR
ncbi:MAG: tetratricopeptide repeat protein, partial [Gammaproteobacteria bacterium]